MPLCHTLAICFIPQPSIATAPSNVMIQVTLGKDHELLKINRSGIKVPEKFQSPRHEPINRPSLVMQFTPYSKFYFFRRGVLIFCNSFPDPEGGVMYRQVSTYFQPRIWSHVIVEKLLLKFVRPQI